MEFIVGSEDEFLDAPRDTERGEEVRFQLSSSSSLEGAYGLSRFVSTSGGIGRLTNLETFVAKHRARKIVLSRLRHLDKWDANVKEKLNKLQQKIGTLEAVVDAGVTDVPDSFVAPVHLPGYYLHIDTGVSKDEIDAYLESHLTPLVLEELPKSPQTPPTDEEDTDEYHSYAKCCDRERKEQLATLQFNLDYLRVKRDALNALLTSIAEGKAALRKKFLEDECDLGCSIGDTDIREDCWVYPGESKLVH